MSIVMNKTESLLPWSLHSSGGDTQTCLVGLRKAKLGKGIEMKERRLELLRVSYEGCLSRRTFEQRSEELRRRAPVCVSFMWNVLLPDIMAVFQCVHFLSSAIGF